MCLVWAYRTSSLALANRRSATLMGLSVPPAGTFTICCWPGCTHTIRSGHKQTTKDEWTWCQYYSFTVPTVVKTLYVFKFSTARLPRSLPVPLNLLYSSFLNLLSHLRTSQLPLGVSVLLTISRTHHLPCQFISSPPSLSISLSTHLFRWREDPEGSAGDRLCTAQQEPEPEPRKFPNHHSAHTIPNAGCRYLLKLWTHQRMFWGKFCNLCHNELKLEASLSFRLSLWGVLTKCRRCTTGTGSLRFPLLIKQTRATVHHISRHSRPLRAAHLTNLKYSHTVVRV